MDILLGFCLFSTVTFIFITIKFWLIVCKKSKHIAKVYKTTENAKRAGYELATKDLMGNFWNMILSFSFSCLIWILYLILI